MSDELDFKSGLKAVEEIQKGFVELKATHEANTKERDVVLEAKLAKINEAMDAAQKRNDDLHLAIKRQQRADEQKDGGNDLEAKAASFSRHVGGFVGEKRDILTGEQLTGYVQLYSEYLRKGLDAFDNTERKALSVGGDPTGGYVVHPDMSGRIVAKVYETSPMRVYASVQTISTDVLEGLYDNDEASSGWVEETGSRDETDTPDLGKWRIPVHEMYANPRATQKILDDAEINIEAWLSMKVADKFSRTENLAFVSGTGVGQPFGFLNATESTDLTVGVEQIDTGANGAFAAIPNGGDVLITAMTALKAPYRGNLNWFMNRTTNGAVRLLKDSNGAYIWSPGIAAGQPATLLGYSVAIFDDMPAYTGTGALAIAVGDMRQAYQVVDRVGIRTLRDPYTAKPYVLFYSTKRVGGGLINGEAIKFICFKS